MSNGALDSILEKLRELFQQEYQRGQQDALRRIVDVMKTRGAGAVLGRGRGQEQCQE